MALVCRQIFLWKKKYKTKKTKRFCEVCAYDTKISGIIFVPVAVEWKERTKYFWNSSIDHWAVYDLFGQRKSENNKLYLSIYLYGASVPRQKWQEHPKNRREIHNKKIIRLTKNNNTWTCEKRNRKTHSSNRRIVSDFFLTNNFFACILCVFFCSYILSPIILCLFVAHRMFFLLLIFLPENQIDTRHSLVVVGIFNEIPSNLTATKITHRRYIRILFDSNAWMRVFQHISCTTVECLPLQILRKTNKKKRKIEYRTRQRKKKH